MNVERDWEALAHHYRRMWQDEKFDNTGSTKPRMGEEDPLASDADEPDPQPLSNAQMSGLLDRVQRP